LRRINLTINQQSCISSGYPTHTSNWDSYCATPTASGIPNCLTASCFGPHTVPASAYTSVESSICSAYSSCASLSRSQTGPYPSECGYWGYGEGPWGAGWGGETGNGWYTVTGSSTHTTGWSTTTQVITTTMSVPRGSTSITIVTSVRTATLVAPEAVVVSTSDAVASVTASQPTSGSASGTSIASKVEASIQTWVLLMSLTLAIMIVL